MNFYPVFIDITKKKCVVVGGGRVAYRKIVTLCGYGAVVEVISPEAIEEIKKLSEKGSINLKIKKYSEDDIIDAFIVFAATNDTEVNNKITGDAKKLNILVNCADSPYDSSFISPAVFNQGDLTIAISTGGKFPKLSQKIKEQLKSQYSTEYPFIIDALEQLRQKALMGINDEETRKKLFDRVVEDDIIQIAMSKGCEAFKERINRIYEEYCHEE
ncbi:MAG: siroheme synthase [Clostridia bacterium]|jgi:siroheme synthase-like protein|uniref:precorrin-2 dehydrogenase/sirohydrochlorin ferrochelatase family protein n=1 Tax=Petroclostridium xylanilyticum TaxID=1792311 RepID=UPI000B998C0F|nr:bifunctional precorrin-2 dehydrogenase/sirohydrochlorin ferrochelatase [Petroclostridium xylanilyticum]MBZ4646440.1 siroheme synthase [Clostridia bacterium]